MTPADRWRGSCRGRGRRVAAGADAGDVLAHGRGQGRLARRYLLRPGLPDDHKRPGADLAEFRAGHARVYPTSITYRVEYDDDGWVESGNRLAARVWITVQRPGERATRIEVVLVAEYRDGKLLWLKEVTWPDWSRLSAFDEYGGPG